MKASGKIRAKAKRVQAFLDSVNTTRGPCPEWVSRARPADTYRGARSNNKRFPTTAQLLKMDRLFNGLSRREADRMRG